jgi:hypothetical protein
LNADKLVSVFFEDLETSLACMSGSLTDSLVHPQKRSKLAIYLIRTTIVGLFLATFISPAIAERFKLTKNEAIATSFICGYAGIKLLNSAEKLLEAEVKKRINKNQVKSTDSSNSSDNSV